MNKAMVPVLPPGGDPDSKVEKIRRRVYELMALGQWRGHLSQVQLAEELETSVMYVAKWSKEVSRELRAAVTADKEELRALVAAGIDAIRVAAIGKKRTFVRKDGTKVEVDDPDYASALRAYELQIRMWGLDAPMEVKHTGAPDWDKLTDEEKREKIAAAEERLVALKKGLP